ncbi:hypothetical protein EDF46_2693 [Frondihabitans sp. PhB188]|uniref:hypothetical protein n=1 Tax=Frondihabitans sp. PhB188 TaxID=2485200 RepID=UPI000F4AE5DA|nr:hypothetical protein [Frondihabitans sp. PhB188]ROQ37237.1 hypothetical protein EDF46_2693 [Frondihabitans sp. PhB188]
MIRLDIIYDGHPYSVAADDPARFKARILAASTSGEPFWLTVNEGEGTVKAVDLLINAHTQISVAAITLNG